VYLANLLMAGGSLQGRAFTAPEASKAVQAICHLGFEDLTRREQQTGVSVIGAFRAGWSLLYEKVTLPAARALVAVLRNVECRDREVAKDLRQLASALERGLADGDPWRARPRFDALASLDLPSWAALLCLIAECPTLHAAATATRVLSVRADDFEFVSSSSQIDAAERFLASLPTRLL
jgi:hypothetical protein